MASDDPVVTCPGCGEEIPVGEGLRSHLEKEAHRKVSKSIKKDMEAEYEKRLAKEMEEETDQRQVLEDKVEKQREELKDHHEVKLELDDLKADHEFKIKEAEAKATRQAKRELNEEFEDKVSARIKEATADDELKIRKLELQAERQNAKIKDLEEQSTAGHGELEGEVLELAAEDTLRDLFPLDSIKAVRKGAFGADIEHTVMSPTAAMSGKILWECKKHKRWQDDWIAKVRQDASDASADIPVIVSTVMPDDKDTFTQIEDVWVCRYHELPLVAALLRHALLAVSHERKRDQNMMTIQERVVDYISGPKFSRVMRSVWEAFNDLNESIRLEENYMKTNRKKNRLLLQSVLDAVTSMAAEIHHLGGGEFDVIRELDFDDSNANLLPSGDSEDESDDPEDDKYRPRPDDSYPQPPSPARASDDSEDDEDESEVE